MNTTSMLLQRKAPERGGARRSAPHAVEVLSAAVAVQLADGQAWSAVAPRGGVVVRCERGRAWVTFEGDGTDHVLSAGESISSSTHGRVAAMGLGPTACRVEPAAGLPH
jgi:hypothetical protein